jgi:hypothetical protein
MELLSAGGLSDLKSVVLLRDTCAVRTTFSNYDCYYYYIYYYCYYYYYYCCYCCSTLKLAGHSIRILLRFCISL